MRTKPQISPTFRPNHSDFSAAFLQGEGKYKISNNSVKCWLLSYTVIKFGEGRPTNDGVYTWGGKILRLLANTAFSETAQDSHTVTMDDLREVVCGLSNGDIGDDLSDPLPSQ